MTKNEFIETYYRENSNKLIKFARKRVGNYCLYLAEEAVQEAFFKALKYYRAYDKEGDFDKWFGKILTNCINDIKNNERDRGVNHSKEIDDQKDMSIEPRAITKELSDLIATQKPQHIEILTMYFLQGFRTKEIAEYLSMSDDRVRYFVSSFRKRVRDD